MTEHFTSNTVSASFWCSKCSKFTQHSISGHRKGHCIPCAERLEKEHQARASQPKPPEQKGLFA